jgi:predicted ArsR family transcriptional regulator
MGEVMTGKDRDEESGEYVDTYPTDEFLQAIRERDGAAGTLEIAEAVGCHRDTARRRLNELAEAGVVRRRDVGDAALWMVDGDGGVDD